MELLSQIIYFEPNLVDIASKLDAALGERGAASLGKLLDQGHVQALTHRQRPGRVLFLLQKPARVLALNALEQCGTTRLRLEEPFER